jgi:hypothetical protein
VTNEFLSDLLAVDIHRKELAAPKGAPVVAFKDGARLVPALKPTHFESSRRFAIARLMADAVIAAASDGLHPLTDRHTARQKLQRSAAQEFLCPIAGLDEHLNLPGGNAEQIPDEDEIEEAAEYFKVSPVLVTTALVNKKRAPRSLLA